MNAEYLEGEDDAIQQIHSFDGQMVWQTRDRELYEVGNFLGGGAAGTGIETMKMFVIPSPLTPPPRTFTTLSLLSLTNPQFTNASKSRLESTMH